MDDIGENLTHPPLETLGDVRRAMAEHCRKIKAGRVEPKQANALTIAYNTLHGMFRDARDSKWTQRIRVLWAEREDQEGAQH